MNGSHENRGYADETGRSFTHVRIVGFNLKNGTQTGAYDLSSYGNRTDFWGMTGYKGGMSGYGW